MKRNKLEKLKRNFPKEKMFNKIVIVLKTGLKIKPEIIDNIKKIASKSEVKVVFINVLKKDNLKDANLIITFGGDGTFVRTANLIEDSLILGINAEPDKSEGTLTSLTIKEMSRLKEILRGNFDVLTWQRAKVRLNGIILDEYALNEVYMGAASQFHSSRYKIIFKGWKEEQRSSGIIVSTGAGSTAWFYSAGGKPFKPEEEKLCFIVREPYLGKRIFKPKILKGIINKGEKLIVESTRDFGGILAINEVVYDFNKGDKAEIELSSKPLKVVKPNNNL